MTKSTSGGLHEETLFMNLCRFTHLNFVSPAQLFLNKHGNQLIKVCAIFYETIHKTPQLLHFPKLKIHLFN